MANKITKKMEMSNNIISTFKNNNYNVVTAIAEFIDNSTQSFYDDEENLRKNNGNPRIDIILHKKKIKNKPANSLYINDNAGGMSPEKLLDALDIGNNTSESSRNEFGMGMKTSAFWFCSEWTIYSKTLDSDDTYLVAVNEEEAVKEGYEFTCEKTIDGYMDYASGTEISLDKFQKNRKLTKRSLENLATLLSSVYRRDIIEKDLEIRVAIKEDGKYADVGKIARNEHDDEYWKNTLDEVQPIFWKEPVASLYDGTKDEVSESFELKLIDDEDEELTCNVRILSMEKGDRKAAGMTFIRNGRVVEGGYNKKLRPSQLFGADNSFESMRIFIEVEVESNWPVTQQKDKLSISDEFREKLYDEIKVKGEKVLKFSRSHRTKTNSKTIESNISQDAQKILLDKMKSFNKEFNNDNIFDIELETINDKEYLWTIKIVENKNEETYKIKSVLITEADDQSDWLDIKVEDSMYIFNINLAHRFFNPFSEDKKYLDLMQRMMFYIMFTEFLIDRQKKIVGIVDPSDFRKYINKLFENDIKE